jgi:hypothetical protein
MWKPEQPPENGMRRIHDVQNETKLSFTRAFFARMFVIHQLDQPGLASLQKGAEPADLITHVRQRMKQKTFSYLRYDLYFICELRSR